MTCDTCCVTIDRPADEVFDFMADAGKLSLWSFGTWQVETDEAGLITGRSIRDGAEILVRIEPHKETGLIDYLIGSDPDALAPRIFVRVIPGSAVGAGDGSTVLTMTALRAAGMDDDRWADLLAAHAFEVRLIKSAIETGYDHRQRS